MNAQIKFGQCLHLLISALNISSNRLAKAINVDPSLVNRWLHEKRIPNYHTNYIESISDFLSNSILNTIQAQRLNETISSICGELEADKDIKFKIKKVLLECQGYSLEHRKAEILERKRKQETENHNYNSLNNAKIENKNTVIFKNNINKNIVSSSEEYNIIVGQENVLCASISLLENAAKQKCKNNDAIYISFNTDVDLLNIYNSCAIRCKEAITKAIKRGWKVFLLIRLTNNIDRTMNFIKFSKSLIETQRFYLYYFKKYDIFTTGKEAIIVPGLGALSCFPNDNNSEIHSAFYFKSHITIDILTNYFKGLIAQYAKPIVKNYTLNSNIEYVSSLAKNENHIGRSFLYKSELSTLTLPQELYEKLLRQKKLSDIDSLQAMSLYENRLKSFLFNVNHYDNINIYTMDALVKLIRYRKYCFNTFNGFDTVTVEAQDIIDHLNNIIFLLEKYDKYKIAFINKYPDFKERNSYYYWKVKEGQSVMIEAWNPLKSSPDSQISIEEPMVIKAFEEYFKDIWEQISPVNKDKSENIKLLKKHIKLLEKS